MTVAIVCSLLLLSAGGAAAVAGELRVLSTVALRAHAAPVSRDAADHSVRIAALTRARNRSRRAWLR